MSHKIAYVFDVCAGVGVGHYSRIRAMRHWLGRIFGDNSVTIGWGDHSRRSSPLINADVQLATCAEVSSCLSTLSPDVVVIDSYKSEQLQFIADQFHVPVKLAFAEAFTADWIDGFDLLLDPTFVAVGSDRPERFITGVNAVLLNIENYLSCDSLQSSLDGVFFNCGKSEIAERFLTRLRSDERLGRKLEVTSGSSFGVFSISEHAHISIGDLNRYAAEVVVAAGQALWEAALNRESFYLAALTPAHANLLDRLARYGVLSLRQVPVLSDVEFPVYHCLPTTATRQRLREPEMSVREIAQAILTVHASAR